jgi:hypothetical protein
LIEARAARKFNSDKGVAPTVILIAQASARVAWRKVLFRCSNHKGNRLATLMIQGNAAAYARQAGGFLAASKLSP